VFRAADVEQLLAKAAPTLRQTPVAEPWSWWPAVQAAWQHGEHEQVALIIHDMLYVTCDTMPLVSLATYCLPSAVAGILCRARSPSTARHGREIDE